MLCPYCDAPIDATVKGLDRAVCASCGASIHLVSDATMAWDPPEAPQTVGRFKLIDLVGSGAFGKVYKAEDTALKRTVAIKVPRAGNLPGSDDSGRFLREARSVSQLRHPSIVPVFEIGHDSGLPYLVSEFIHGITLADLLSSERLSFRAAAHLVAEIADALHYAHQQGVTHRDVKPSNIMLELRSRSEAASDPVLNRYTPRLMDFGLAKQDGGDITMTTEGQVLGTPAYMSPEQAGGMSHSVDGRSDIYSLGVILYQLLAGQLPFQGNARMLLHHVLHSEPKPLRQRDAQIPKDLETICLQAMAKDPARRYATAADFAADLRHYLRSEPISARSAGWHERLWNLGRKNPLMSGLIAAVVLLLGTLVIMLISNGLSGNSPVSSVVQNADSSSHDELMAASAELDQADPGWRFEDLEAARAPVAEDQNGAGQIARFRTAVAELTERPQSEGTWQRPELADRLNVVLNLAAHEPLSDDDAATFRHELNRMAKPLELARGMTAYPQGRFKIAYTRDYVSMMLPEQVAARHLAALLELDAIVNLHDGQPDLAIRNCQSIFHCCAAFRDEPIALTQAIRTSIFRRGVGLLERILAHGVCSDADLTMFQDTLTAANETPVHVTMARGDRAMLHYFLGSLETGDFSPGTLQVFKVPSREHLPSVDEIRRFHAWMLRHYSRWVQIAQQPPETWYPALVELDGAFAQAPARDSSLVNTLRDLSTQLQSAATVLHHLSEVRGALNAVALERFRISNHRWPDDLRALVPTYLSQGTTDPYDGQPIKSRRLADGVVVYCLGPDFADDQGNLANKRALETGTDVGFRLWDTERRTAAASQ